MSLKTVEQALAELGLADTNAERLAAVAADAHRQVCKMDLGQLSLAHKNAVVDAFVILAEFYGMHNGPGTRFEFLEDQ